MGIDKAISPSDGGATGGLALDKHLERADLALIERAVRKGWDIPDSVKIHLPKIVCGILDNEESSDRDRLRAAEIMAGLDKANREAVLDLIKTRRLVNGESTENVSATVKILKGVSMDDL